MLRRSFGPSPWQYYFAMNVCNRTSIRLGIRLSPSFRSRYLVTWQAAARGLVAVVWGRRFSYGGMFVEMFWVCEPQAVKCMPLFDG